MKAKRFSRVLDRGWEPLCPGDIPPVDAWEMIDVDEYLERVREMDLETDRVHLLNERRFWLITFRHMSHGLGKGVFGKAFFHQEAQDARYIAIHGLSQSRRSEVMELVKATRIFYRADRDQMIADFPSFDGEGEFQPTPFLCAEAYHGLPATKRCPRHCALCGVAACQMHSCGCFSENPEIIRNTPVDRPTLTVCFRHLS